MIVQTLPTGIYLTKIGAVDETSTEKTMVGPKGTRHDTVTGHNALAGKTSSELLIITLVTVRLAVFNTVAQATLDKIGFVLLLYQSCCQHENGWMLTEPRLQWLPGVKGPFTSNFTLIVQPGGKLEMRNRD